MQEADEGGGHDVAVFAAELKGGLDAVVHHQRQVLVDRVRPVVGELEERERERGESLAVVWIDGWWCFTTGPPSSPSSLDTL